MLLRDAVGVARGEMVSLIGTGGKTTTMFRLAKQLRNQSCQVLVATTTKMIKPAKPQIDRLFLGDELQALLDVCGAILPPAIIRAGCGMNQRGELIGMPVAWLDRLNQDASLDAILVGADGAESCLLEIPAAGEAGIPQSCQTTLWIVAVKVLGKPLAEVWVHRAARARDLLDLPADSSVSEDILIQLLQHRDGCLKAIPSSSRKIAIMNQVDSPAEMAADQALGDKLQRQGSERVVMTSYASTEPVIQGMAQ